MSMYSQCVGSGAGKTLGCIDTVECEGWVDSWKQLEASMYFSLKDASPIFKNANQHLLHFNPELLIQFLIPVISSLPWGNGNRDLGICHLVTECKVPLGLCKRKLP